MLEHFLGRRCHRICVPSPEVISQVEGGPCEMAWRAWWYVLGEGRDRLEKGWTTTVRWASDSVQVPERVGWS